VDIAAHSVCRTPRNCQYVARREVTIAGSVKVANFLRLSSFDARDLRMEWDYYVIIFRELAQRRFHVVMNGRGDRLPRMGVRRRIEGMSAESSRTTLTPLVSRRRFSQAAVLMNQGRRRYKHESSYCFPRESLMRKHWKRFLSMSKRWRDSDSRTQPHSSGCEPAWRLSGPRSPDANRVGGPERIHTSLTSRLRARNGITDSEPFKDLRQQRTRPE
jgi:hypothetical protein